MFDIAVIGAGVVGALIADRLSRYELDVCVLEKEDDAAMGATKANSAIVHAGFDAKEGSLKAKLNVRGSEMMEEICRDLGVKYKKNGSLVVGFSHEDLEVIKELKKRGEKNGVRDLSILSREEILAIEPNIGKDVTCALSAPTGAIVCPYELALSAIGHAMDNGVRFYRSFDVKEIRRENGYFSISSGAGIVDAKYVINCAGVYSDGIAKAAGDDSFTVHARRGEYMLLDKSAGNSVSRTIFTTPSKMGKGILVSPTVDGNLLLGPTAVDIDDKNDKKTTAEGLDSVKMQANRSVSGIPMNKVITSFTGLRAVGSTGDFIINEKDGFVNCAGIESPGLSSAPAIAEYVCRLLEKAGLSFVEKKDFDRTFKPFHWFSRLSDEEKNAVIEKDPRYAHVICRCETVTEGEIADVINRNPVPFDVDGIKRRLRAGMGRCQGGFCSPYVVKMLADARETSLDRVKKCGGESYMLVGKTGKAFSEGGSHDNS